MKDLWTSISAFENAYGKDGQSGGCVRRWWFDKICKLPKRAYAPTIFGDVFHAVLARFYLADDRGLDATGKPVNLYPEGWKSVKSRFSKTEEVVGEITDLEETLIRTLVDKAIADGYLIREPGRLVEREIERSLYTDPLTGQKIILKGFIDLETHRSIEDHKTSKATKWLVSAKKLAVNAQLLTYGWDKYERGHTGTLWLAHNNYIKDFDDPQVIFRSIPVEKDYVYDYFNQIILPRFKDMLKFSQKYPKSEVERWRELPPPDNSEKECNYHYGRSCDYIGICTGQCSVALYQAKYESIRKEDTNMSLIDQIKARNAATMAASTTTPAAPAPTEAPAPAPAAPAAPAASNPMDILKKIQPSPVPSPAPAPAAPEAPAEPVDDRPKAPWHFPGCVACKDNVYGGFNSKGSACDICDAQSEQHGKLKSTDYTWDYDADNNLVFTQVPGATPTFPEKAEQAPTETTPPAEEKTVKTRKPRTKKQTADPAPAEAPELLTTEKIEEIKQTLATPKPGGFVLMIGCSYFKTGGTVPISADDILTEALKTIEQAAGKPVAQIDHFELLKGLDAYIPTIAENLASQGAAVTAFHPTKGTALARLVDGLRQHADTVIVNIGM